MIVVHRGRNAGRSTYCGGLAVLGGITWAETSTLPVGAVYVTFTPFELSVTFAPRQVSTAFTPRELSTTFTPEP